MSVSRVALTDLPSPTVLGDAPQSCTDPLPSLAEKTISAPSGDHDGQLASATTYRATGLADPPLEGMAPMLLSPSKQAVLYVEGDEVGCRGPFEIGGAQAGGDMPGSSAPDATV